jgi:hypothetical protein
MSQTLSPTLSSLSHLSAQLGVSVARIVAVVDKAGIRPSVYLNATPYWNEAGEQRIRQALEGKAEGNR